MPEDIIFPLPADIKEVWTEDILRRFLAARQAEDKHFECKAFLHFDPELRSIAQEVGDTKIAEQPFHSVRPAGSYMAYRVIESIIAFANSEGGLLLLGVAEERGDKNLPKTDGVAIHGDTGEVNFLITGIESDGVGLDKGRLDGDDYIRKLQDILFPKGTGRHSYTALVRGEKKGAACLREKTFQASFPARYRADSLVRAVKLIPFPSSGGKNLTVAALIIIPGFETVEVTEHHENKYEVLKIYRRIAFNNNGPLTGGQATEYLRERLAKVANETLAQHLTALIDKIERLEGKPPGLQPFHFKTPEDLVPWLFREVLTGYIVPMAQGRELPACIRELVEEGKNVFILAESGMGKSLLIAHCYLSFGRAFPSCYYSIDRTQGPNVYRTAAVLGALREQIQAKADVEAHLAPPWSESKAIWVWELEYLQAVLRFWQEKNPGERMVVFLDGLDENDEAIESEFILNALKDLIRDTRNPVTWVMSSQPRPGMEWLQHDLFKVFNLAGLDLEQARTLIKKYLLIGISKQFPVIFDELVARCLLPGGLYDPEMLAMLGRAIAEKFAGIGGKISFISEKVFTTFVTELPLTPREKYGWLFKRYTDPVKFAEIPSLAQNATEWDRRGGKMPYTTFLTDILAVIASIRRPIPEDILIWAMELEDQNAEEDFRGRKRAAFISYQPELLEAAGFLQIALRDLRRFIKTVDAREGGYSFCKDAVKQGFLASADPSRLKSARRRLTELVMAELAIYQSDNLFRRPSYFFLEFIFLLSLSPESAYQGIKELMHLEFFPEWLQERALRDSAQSWVAGFLADFRLVEELPVSSAQHPNREALLMDYVRDWQQHLDTSRLFVADFIRGGKIPRQYWSPCPATTSVMTPTDGYQRVLNGHFGPISCLVWLPDGRLASGSQDATIRVWDVDTGCSIALEGHRDVISCLTILPNGRLASGSYDRTVRVWEVATGRSHLINVGKAIHSIAAFPDGRLAIGGFNGFVYLCDLESGHIEILEFSEKDKINDLVVLKNNLLAATAGEDKTISLWHGDGGFFTSSTGHSDKVVALARLADGRLASVGRDGTCIIWDVDTDNSIVVNLHLEIFLIVISSDGNFVSVCLDGLIRAGNVIRAQSLTLNIDFSRVPCSCAVISEGQFALGTWNRKILVSDLNSDRNKILEGHLENEVNYIVGLPDGRFAYDNKDTIYFWDPHTGQSNIFLEGVDELDPGCFAVLPDGRFAYGTWDSVIHVWDKNSGEETLLVGHRGSVKCFAILPNGLLVSGSEDGTVRVWDVDSGHQEIFRDHTDLVKCLVALSDGQFVSGSWDETIRVWDLSSGRSVVLVGHRGSITCLAALPDGRLVSGSSEDPTVRIWDVNTRQSIILTGHTDFVICLAVLPDGRFASGSHDKTIRIWRPAASLQDETRCEKIWFSESSVTAIYWHEESSQLVVGTRAGLKFLKLE